VKAIVAQDQELYPQGDASVMTAGPKYFLFPQYKCGDREFTLNTLAIWVRRTRGLRRNNTKALPNSQILERWKKDLFGIDQEPVEKNPIYLRLDFPISESPTEDEIGKIVKAIVAQDQDFYPEGDASAMSSGSKYLSRHRYRSGDREFMLGTLVGWV